MNWLQDSKIQGKAILSYKVIKVGHIFHFYDTFSGLELSKDVLFYNLVIDFTVFIFIN